MAVTTYTIKQPGIVSIGKFFAVFGLVWGFFAGIFFAAGLGSMGSVMGTHALGFGAGLVGLVIMVIMVIVGGIVGFTGGVIVAIVYNIVLGAIVRRMGLMNGK
jgi:hypothetical protein